MASATFQLAPRRLSRAEFHAQQLPNEVAITIRVQGVAVTLQAHNPVLRKQVDTVRDLQNQLEAACEILRDQLFDLSRSMG